MPSAPTHFAPLTAEQWQFVADHISANTPMLRLRFHSKPELTPAIVQIECRQKAAVKLTETLASTPQFTFPGLLAAEQCTSDRLAKFHSTLIDEGWKVADLTCGLGIDAMHMAGRASSVIAIERNPDVAAAAAFNSGIAGLSNMNVINADSRLWLEAHPEMSFDAIFIDPARRASDGSRVFVPKDCEPDIIALLPLLRRHAPRLIIKASPMLDIAAVTAELEQAGATVTDIYATGTATECKELVICLFTESKSTASEPRIHAVTPDVYPEQTFTRSTEAQLAPVYARAEEVKPGAILLEPAPAIMKAGGFRSLAATYGVAALSEASHLYVSPTRVADWPGRNMIIRRVLPFSSSSLKSLAAEKLAANISVRCFPYTAPQLAKKLGIRSSGRGNIWLIGATIANGPVIIEAELTEVR